MKLCDGAQVSDQPRVSFVAAPGCYTTTSGEAVDETATGPMTCLQNLANRQVKMIRTVTKTSAWR